MHANNREDIKEAFAGDIVALAGLKDSAPATRCATRRSPSSSRRWSSRSRSSRSRSSRSRRPTRRSSASRLSKLAAEDPSFRVSTDQESRPDHPQGDGRAPSRHQGRHPASAPTRSRPTSAPRRWPIARRSRDAPRSTTRTRSRPAARASSRASSSSSSRTSRARASSSSRKIVGGSVPKEYIPGVEKGLESVLGSGVARRLPGRRPQGRS